MMEGALLPDIGTPRVKRRRRCSRTKYKEEVPNIFHFFLPQNVTACFTPNPDYQMGPCVLELPPHMISKPGWQLESRLTFSLKTHSSTPSWKVHQSPTDLNSSFSAAPAHSATHLWVTAGGRLRLVPTLYNLPNRHGRAPCPSSSSASTLLKQLCCVCVCGHRQRSYILRTSTGELPAHHRHKIVIITSITSML